MADMSDLYIGLMSGTSLDGVDGVLVDFSPSQSKMTVLCHAGAPFSVPLRDELLALNSSGADEIHRAALASNALARVYAGAVSELLHTAKVQIGQVKAIGAHGQTVRHRPQEFDLDAAAQSGIAGAGYTVQLNNPALLAELTGIDVVADFRSRDVAAGGQGAPLVPAFHAEVFDRPNEAVAVLNIGGISNITLLPPQSAEDKGTDGIAGFDCGPGNALMDYWCHKHTGQAYDDNGAWAASGMVNAELLNSFLTDSYFTRLPPKSTGRDQFNPTWLATKLAGCAHSLAADVQATLTELTARVCSDSLLRFQKNGKKLIVCGGGALNGHLMKRLRDNLPNVLIASSEHSGLPPLQVEACAFAWLARKTVRRETSSLPKVTGANGARILGAIYPA